MLISSSRNLTDVDDKLTPGERRPRSGITVIGVDAEETMDSFTILGVLIGQAAARTRERVTPDELAHLRELSADVSAHSGDESIGEANWLFHQPIQRATHSARLLAQIRQAARVVPTNFLTVFPDHEKHSLSEHEELLDALEQRDTGRARAIAEYHVLEAGRFLTLRLEQRRT